MESEIWLDVPSYENLYQVSNMGHLRSVKRGKQLKLRKSMFGYLRVGLYKDGKPKSYAVHRIVALAFIPNPNNYPHVNHLDSVRINNRVDNLEWCTRIQNAQHALMKGRYIIYKGSKHINAKLTPDQVGEIKNLYKMGGKSQWALARKYGVTQMVISRIVRGLTYKDDILAELRREDEKQA